MVQSISIFLSVLFDRKDTALIIGRGIETKCKRFF